MNNRMSFQGESRKSTLVIAVILLLASASGAAEIPVAPPESVGMSGGRLEQLVAATQEFVDEGKFAGVLAMVAREGRIVHVSAVGQRGVDDDRPLTEDALFRIYSMSKPITAVTAMMLYEEDAFELDDPVAKFLPELKKLEVLGEDGDRVPVEKTMTMQHLLTHTAGFSYGFDPNDPVDSLYNEVNPLGAADLDEFIERLATLPLKYEPGVRWHYSVASDVVGAVVARISGQSFDVFLRERLFRPLDMRDTFFNVPEDKMSRLLPNHIWDPKEGKFVAFDGRKMAKGRPATMYSGGGGLTSTARDYMRFAEMLRNGGELDGVRILRPETVNLMITNHLPAALSGAGRGELPLDKGEKGKDNVRGFGFGLGFGLVTELGDEGVGSVGEYSWGGAAGTVFWVDPVEGIIVIGMIQLMGSPWPLREKLKELTYEAITDRAASG